MALRMCLILALAASAAGAFDSPKTVARDLQKKYDELGRAFVKRDVAAIMKKTSPDLTSRRPDGQVWNRSQLQVYLNLALGMLKTVDVAKFKVRKVTLKGDEATAIVDHRAEGTLPAVGNGKPRKIVDVSTDRDIWVKTPEGWKVKFTECLKEKVTIDGKRVDPMKAASSTAVPNSGKRQPGPRGSGEP